MARDFNGTSDRLVNLTAPITAYPFTIACWANNDDAVITRPLVSLNDGVNAGQRWLLEMAGAVAGDPVRFTARDGGGETSVDTTTGFTAGVWHHACGVGVSATDRTVYIDGGSAANNATSRSPTVDRIHIAERAANNVFYNGRVAEAAIWNIDLTAAEVAQLAKGMSPLYVRPFNIVAYWPMIGRTDPEPDRMGTYHLTVMGATWAAHPRIFPWLRRIFGAFVAVGGGPTDYPTTINATVLAIATLDMAVSLTLSAVITAVASLLSTLTAIQFWFTGHGGMGYPKDQGTWAPRQGAWVMRKPTWRRRR